MASVGDRDGLNGGRSIVLAHEKSFRLGRAKVDPSTRRIEADGRAETIEPRMMQVLVVMARARGEVVTRDEVVTQCWDGRIVGEDAVNRVFFRLRQLSQVLGPGTFRIETIPRVGYRLDVTEAAIADTARQPGAPLLGLSRRAVGLGVLALGGAALVGKLALAGNQSAYTPLPEAKRYFDLAQDARGQLSYSQTEQSMAYLKEAVRVDPNFADAWGELAVGYSQMLNWFAPRSDADQLKILSRSAARRALQLDPENVDAKYAQICLESCYGRWTEQEGRLRAFIADHPDFEPARRALATVMTETGRLEEALRVLRTLDNRDRPSASYRAFLTDALLSADRLEEAEDQIDESLRIWPRKFTFWSARIELLLVSGRKDEALRYMYDASQRPLELVPQFGKLVQVFRAVATGDAGDHDRALEMVRTGGRQPPGDLAIAAMQAAFLGDLDLSFSMYHGYFLDRGPWRVGPQERRFSSGLFKVETRQLRRDPRFASLVREIGLERYWRLAHAAPAYRMA